MFEGQVLLNFMTLGFVLCQQMRGADVLVSELKSQTFGWYIFISLIDQQILPNRSLLWRSASHLRTLHMLGCYWLTALEFSVCEVVGLSFIVFCAKCWRCIIWSWWKSPWMNAAARFCVRKPIELWVCFWRNILKFRHPGDPTNIFHHLPPTPPVFYILPVWVEAVLGYWNFDRLPNNIRHWPDLNRNPGFQSKRTLAAPSTGIFCSPLDLQNHGVLSFPFS